MFKKVSDKKNVVCNCKKPFYGRRVDWIETKDYNYIWCMVYCEKCLKSIKLIKISRFVKWTNEYNK